MSVYMVTYDLHRATRKQYDDLIAAIEDDFNGEGFSAFNVLKHSLLTGDARDVLKSTWIVTTPLNAVGIRDKLRSHFSEGDKLLVLRLSATNNAELGLGNNVAWYNSLPF